MIDHPYAKLARTAWEAAAHGDSGFVGAVLGKLHHGSATNRLGVNSEQRQIELGVIGQHDGFVLVPVIELDR